MTLGDISSYVRILLTESDASGRWSDADLATLVNRGCRAVSMAIRFPENQLSGSTIAGQQEYTLNELLEVKRVYVAGQRLMKTTIPQLEGDSLELYDQTGANYAPQWTVAPAATYPVANDTGYPAPIASPYYPGVRPSFYLRGGVIGLVPAPSGVFSFVVQGIALPPDLANLTDVSIYPRHFIDAIAWKTVEYALFADRNMEAVQWAQAEAEKAMGELREWKSSFTSPHRAGVLTYRTFFDPSRW